MRHVGVGRRFVAVLIDAMLLAIIAGSFADVTSSPGYLRVSWSGTRALWPGLIGIVYFVVLEALAGATIGKFAVGIRVVHENGSDLTWAGAVVRNVARLVDLFPYAIPYLLGAIVAWSSPARQRLGDRWASTVVVTKDSLSTRGSVTDGADAWVAGPPLPPAPPSDARSPGAPPGRSAPPMPPPPAAPDG
jgi:uncharacterized RDD family membrane protein YckC